MFMLNKLFESESESIYLFKLLLISHYILISHIFFIVGQYTTDEKNFCVRE